MNIFHFLNKIKLVVIEKKLKIIFEIMGTFNNSRTFFINSWTYSKFENNFQIQNVFNFLWTILKYEEKIQGFLNIL